MSGLKQLAQANMPANEKKLNFLLVKQYPLISKIPTTPPNKNSQALKGNKQKVAFNCKK